MSDSGASDSGSPSMDSGADATAPSPDAGSDAPIAPPDGGGTCFDDPAPSPDRPTAVACSSCRPIFPEPGPDPGGTGCTMHSECTDGTNGRCVRAMIGTYCDYDECFMDSDCASDQVCSCNGSLAGGNACVPSNCRVNSDCGARTCSPSYGCLLGAPPEGWYCHTAGDMCATDTDCDRPGKAGGRCAYDTTQGFWACDYGICVF